jgi:hypothetical protein
VKPIRRRGQRGQVLIILFVGTLLLGASAGGMDTVFSEGAVHTLRKELKGVVTDAARRHKLDPVLDAMDAEARRFSKEHGRLGSELLELMAKHDATPAEFDQLLAQVDTVNAQSRNVLLDLRFRLRSGLSAPEWKQLFDAIQARH